MIILSLGFHGKILVVNLSKQSYSVVEIDEEIYRQYLGGYGLGVYYIYKNIQPGVDPLGPENILGFLPGLLTGSPAPMTGRYMVCAKSPLTGKGRRTNGEFCTGGWGNSNSGGFFGPAIRKTGFDGIFITGKAEHPVYLLIKGEEITIEDANDLWDRDVVETEQLLKEKHGNRFEIASIGPAGENLSLISGIVTDMGRIAARSGLGAVMGSKNLKAICLKGNEKIDYANKSKMVELSRGYNRTIRNYQKNEMLNKTIPIVDRFSPLIRKTKMQIGGGGSLAARFAVIVFSGSKLGTTFTNVLFSQNGDSPVKNFKGIGHKDFPMKKALKIRGKSFKRYIRKDYGCYGCPVRCGAILEFEGLPYKEKSTHRPEYETCAAFGPLILNDDRESILQINEYLNRVGMDSISAGNVIAFVLEAVEKGLLNKSDFVCQDFPEGFLPTWGSSELILPILKLMVNREGIGDSLADGTKKAAENIGKGEDFSINANGQELPMHDPRFEPEMAMTYITDPTPGRHTAGSLDFESAAGINYFVKEIEFGNSKDTYQKGKHSAKVTKFYKAFEALGFCSFATAFGRYPFFEMIKAAFGWIITPEEILQIGHRIQTLRQMFNAREGAIRHEINQRAIGSPPLEKGPLKDVSLDLETMAQGYYDTIGYKKDGVPKKKTLESLGLEFCIKDLDLCTGLPEPLVNEYLVKEKREPHHWKLKQ